MVNQPTEVAVVGGGMVGGALALGLAQQGFAVTVIEQAAPPAFDASIAPDVRISAISTASVALLRGLGVWDSVLAMRCHPWRRRPCARRWLDQGISGPRHWPLGPGRMDGRSCGVDPCRRVPLHFPDVLRTEGNRQGPASPFGGAHEHARPRSSRRRGECPPSNRNGNQRHEIHCEGLGSARGRERG